MFLALAAVQAGDPFGVLRAYDGTWQVTPTGQAKTDTLVNQCAVLGKFYACGQTVNGKSVGMVIFIPQTDKPGHFKTQTIMAEGRATGLVDLQIEGEMWTYMSRRDEYGKTTFYRTINQFTGKNRIHFEQAHSSDGKQWIVDGAGDEVRRRP